MQIEQLRESFHALFNKINNIFTAAGSNKIILEGEDLNKLSEEKLKEIISDLLEALAMIEKNATLLNKSLQDIYTILKKESGSATSDSLPPSAKK